MATMVAAMIAKARRDILAHFRQVGALSAETATRFVPEQPIGRRLLARLIDAGVVIQTAPDTYYLDEAADRAWRRTAIGRVGVAAMIGAAVVATIVALTV